MLLNELNKVESRLREKAYLTGNIQLADKLHAGCMKLQEEAGLVLSFWMLVGRIQLSQELLKLPVSGEEDLAAMPLEQKEALNRELFARVKRIYESARS